MSLFYSTWETVDARLDWLEECCRNMQGIGNISVSDEGTLVNAEVCSLNFIGADVLSNQNQTNPCQVDVYIPTPQYPSHYNTSDGFTNGIIASLSVSDRHVSEPDGAHVPVTGVSGEFNENGWADRVALHPCSRDTTPAYYPVGDILLDDLATILNVKIFDADGTTILAEHELDPIDSDTTTSGSGITITISLFGPVSDKYSARLDVDIDLSQIIPNSGRFTVVITHTSGGVDYVKSQELFYDAQSNSAMLSGVTINENAATRITKNLSGIQYYDLGSPFEVDISDIDYLNGESYPDTQVVIACTDLGVPTLNLGPDGGTGHDLTGWIENWNDNNDSYNNDDWKITATNYCFIGDAVADAHTVDWVNGSDVNSNSYPALVNTWTQQSDALSEYFIDEAYRLESDSATPFDSSQDLNTYDGGVHAQQICGKLKVPSTSTATNNNNPDFSTSNPLTNPDYTGANGNEYYRKFFDITNSVRTSFIMDIQGFTLNDLETCKVEIWIFIPGKMTTPCPVHGSSTYNFGTYDADMSTGTNTLPCGPFDDAMRVLSSTTNSINVSLGNYGLDATHNALEMKLVINDSTIEPSEILISW